jgi:hypothetical protein
LPEMKRSANWVMGVSRYLRRVTAFSGILES